MSDPPSNAGSENEKDTELIGRAQLLLSERLGAAVRFRDVTRISESRRRNLLLRCRLEDGPVDAPASVILKRARQRRYDPDNPKSRAAVGLFRDWAGLEFLSSLDSDQLASPRFYGGDREAGFFLMEDLGGSIDLDHVLNRGCASQARHALTLLAKALGRMHAVTTGRSEQYQKIRDALGPGDQMHRQRLAKHARDYAPHLIERCQRLGVNVISGFSEDIDKVAEAMAEPGDFLAYTHADACPDNSVLVGNQICLIDYEFGSFRHALLDGVYGWIRFPTCWCVRDIPDAVVAEMETAYRAELAQGCPAAADDDQYFRGVADACGYWLLENLAQLFDRALQYEEPKGTSTNRQRLLVRLAAFRKVALRAGHLESLQGTLESLLDRLRDRWRDNTPLYDAFAVPRELADDDVEQIVAAVRDGHTERVTQLLVKNPALAHARDGDADQTPVLYLAVDTQDTALVRLLLENGALPRATTRSGWTVLSRACSQSTPAVVDLLLNAGAELDERDAWGTLPLYGAMGNRTMMLHLLKRGATADVKMAIDTGRVDVAAKILESDPVQAQMRFGTGLTLLHDSARVGDARLPAMELLLKYGADVNAVTNWEATPLHLAAFHGHTKAAAFLIENGAALGSEDDYGLTPMGLAEVKGHKECAELIRRRLEEVGKSVELALAIHTVNAGAGLSEVSDEEPGADERLSAIDAFYNSFGRGDENDLHPMDEIELALFLKKRRRQSEQRPETGSF